MKKIAVLLLTGLLVCMAGCGEKNATEAEKDNNTKVEATEEQDASEKDDQKEQETEETVEGLMKNTTGLYREDDLIGELPVGYKKDGVPTVVGYIKISAEGTLAADGWDENNEDTPLVGGGPAMDYFKDDFNEKYVFDGFIDIVEGQEYSISINDQSKGSKEDYIEYVKGYFPDAVTIDDADYPAIGLYNEKSDGSKYFAVEIALNDDRVLRFVVSGTELYEELGAEELTDRIYNLFTPVE